jgi:tRNA C32,U32 (ribose-2'-O)-methylase TrmJ
MLTVAQRSRVVIVLVGARNPLNVGAVARAMRDFGFTDLRVVSDYAVPLDEARRSAIAADTVLLAARAIPTVAEAIADCTLVIGTTAIGERGVQHPVHTLAEAAGQIGTAFGSSSTPSPKHAHLEALSDDEPQHLTSPAAGTPLPRIALLFGSEKTGLTNDALSHCDWLLHIPMQQADGERHVSMNLGQAAAVCLYELTREAADSQGSGDIRPRHRDSLAKQRDVAEPPQAETSHTQAAPTSGDLERLTQSLLQVMQRSGYIHRHPANSSETQVRRLVKRIGAVANDVPAWMGLCKQILWALRDGATEDT